MPDWVDRILYPAPDNDTVSTERVPVAGEVCGACGSHDVRRYPIANHLGPRMTVTCQACLHVLRVERPGPEDRWPPFRAVAYDWDASPAERASVVAQAIGRNGAGIPLQDAPSSGDPTANHQPDIRKGGQHNG